MSGRNRQEFALVASERFAQRLARYETLLDWVAADLVQIFHHVGISVGIAVGEIDHIIRVFEVVGECVRVVAAACLVIPSKSVVIIPDFGSSAMPAHVFMQGHALRVDKNLHSLVVQAVRLAQIEDIEAGWTLLHIRGSKEEPLRVPRCINIVLEEQHIFLRVDLARGRQVTRLESRLEYNGHVLCVLVRVVGFNVDLH